MSMSRKDFVAIAKAISEARTKAARNPQRVDDAFESLARDIAGVCADSNSLFRYNTFMEACEPEMQE